MRTIILSISFLFLLSNAIQGQDIQHVEIGINGLHCSACTYSVEKSLRKLPFVSVVSMDLNERNGLVYFTVGDEINFRKLAKAVVDAGFSVRSMEVLFKSDIQTDADCLLDQVCILEKKSPMTNRLSLVGKHFQEKKAIDPKWKNSSCECAFGNKAVMAISI